MPKRLGAVPDLVAPLVALVSESLALSYAEVLKRCAGSQVEADCRRVASSQTTRNLSSQFARDLAPSLHSQHGRRRPRVENEFLQGGSVSRAMEGYLQCLVPVSPSRRSVLVAADTEWGSKFAQMKTSARWSRHGRVGYLPALPSLFCGQSQPPQLPQSQRGRPPLRRNIRSPAHGHTTTW